MNLKGQSVVVLAGAVVGLGGAGHSLYAFEPPEALARVRADERTQSYRFAHESILGTSLDLIVHASSPAQAVECEHRILAEIERLRMVLSTYDPTSEISRIKQGESHPSADLDRLLAAYALWGQRTDGAIGLNIQSAISLWKQCAAANTLPGRAQLQEALRASKAWNVDALGKGFIIDRAVEVAREVAPSGLLNIGGDIRAWGDRRWKIGVADPRDHAENAGLLTTFAIFESAVASSGGYERFHTIDGIRYSHILDPRTGWPVDHRTSATILASDCVTANALATAATVMGAEPGESLAKAFGAGGHAIVDAGGPVRTGGAIAGPVRPIMAMMADAAPAWPKDYQVAIEIALKDPSAPTTGPSGPPARGGARRGGGYKRPYVAVWVHDANQKVVRTISVWGNQPRWLPELSYWWKAADETPIETDTIARATRPPGKYTVTWDGKNDKGQSVAPGQYTITVEFNREHGRHVKESAVIECNGSPQSVTLKATPESDAGTIAYGPRGN